MAKMEKIPDYTEWALKLKKGDQLVIEDNSYVTDKQGRPASLVQHLSKKYSPIPEERGATFKVMSIPKILKHYTVMGGIKILPTVKVKSSKTGIEYQVGICWLYPNPFKNITEESL